MTSTKAIQQLVSIHLFENQLQNNLFMKWTFPTISHSLRQFIEKQLSDEYFDSNPVMNTRYRCHHFEDVWIYMNSSEPNVQNSLVLPEVRQYSLVIVSKDFNPEKYEIFAKIFTKVYLKTGDIQRLLSYYLTILITGSLNVSEEELENNYEKFTFEDYDRPEVFHSKSAIKSVVKMFGLDVILIYTALILKRRIVVYHHKLDTLLQFIRVLPVFVWHRHDCYQMLYPYVDITSQSQIHDLQSHSHYVAGFTESDVENRMDLYDIYVNLAAVEITVSHTSRDVFAMTKTHKEIAVFITRQADNTANSDWDVIRDISDKNHELIKNLKLMADIVEDEENKTKTLNNTIESIKAKKLNPNLEYFLCNLAVAENIV